MITTQVRCVPYRDEISGSFRQKFILPSLLFCVKAVERGMVTAWMSSDEVEALVMTREGKGV